MTVEEAVDRMELVGHDFFLYAQPRRVPPQGLGLRRDLAHHPGGSRRGSRELTASVR
jgi:hypothetical protein